MSQLTVSRIVEALKHLRIARDEADDTNVYDILDHCINLLEEMEY